MEPSDLPNPLEWTMRRVGGGAVGGAVVAGKLTFHTASTVCCSSPFDLSPSPDDIADCSLSRLHYDWIALALVVMHLTSVGLFVQEL